MKIKSVNVGLPRQVEWQGQIVTTGIFKESVKEKINIKILNLDGDQQADLTVHGGVDMAVYGYPAEHYEYWKKTLPDVSFPWGVFGENLTLQGIFEDSVNIGDIFQIGTAKLKVTKPRVPCYKLGLRFQRLDMVRLFLQSKTSGWYFRVLEEGEVEVGDEIRLLHQDPHKVSVADIIQLYAFDKHNKQLLEKAVQVPALPDDWKDYFIKRLSKMNQ